MGDFSLPGLLWKIFDSIGFPLSFFLFQIFCTAFMDVSPQQRDRSCRSGNGSTL